MVKSDFGERMAKVEIKIDNLEKGFASMSSKVDDIYTALLGDGKQNCGALSRIQTLENSKKFTKYLTGVLLSLLSLISGYLAFFK